MKAYRCVFSLFLLLFAGCNQLNHDREAIDKFASAYIAFSKSIDDTDVIGWVIVLDQQQSDDEDRTAYRVAFGNAFNVRSTNEFRAEAARDALRLFKNKSTSMLDDFDEREDTLNKNLLTLVESANAIRNKDYRQQAIQIGESAKNVKYAFTQLRVNFADVYNMQTRILKSVDRENGNLSRILDEMKTSVAQKTKLTTVEKDLRSQKETATQQMREQYAAFKGMTGITLDYVEPTSPSQEK
jgi:hypothetical protein